MILRQILKKTFAINRSSVMTGPIAAGFCQGGFDKFNRKKSNKPKPEIR